mgnify:CR=1 FL=1
MDITQTAVKLILDRWEASMKNFDTLLKTLTDDQLQREISPGKNRGIYLLGHLIAVPLEPVVCHWQEIQYRAILTTRIFISLYWKKMRPNNCMVLFLVSRVVKGIM